MLLVHTRHDPATHMPPGGSVLEGHWEDAIDSERLVLVSEWAAARNLTLPMAYDAALSPELLDAIEAIPFSEVHTSTEETRMVRLIRQLEQLADHQMSDGEGLREPLSFNFVASLSTRSDGAGCPRLWATLYPSRRRVVLACAEHLDGDPALLRESRYASAGQS